MSEQTKQAEQAENHWSVAFTKIAFCFAILVLIGDTGLALFYWGTFDGMNIFRIVLWGFGTYWLQRSAARNPTQRKGIIAVFAVLINLVGVLYAIAALT